MALCLGLTAASAVTLNMVEVQSAGKLNIDSLNDTVRREFVGQEVSHSLLQKLLSVISRYYIEQGFPESKAFLPEQDGVNGKLVVRVVTPEIVRMIFNNRDKSLRTSAADRLTASVKELKLRRMGYDELRGRLLRLTDLGIFDIVGSWESTNSPDLVTLKTNILPKDRYNFHIFTDNHGNKSTGRYRVGATFMMRNVTGNADRLTAFAARTTEAQNNFSLGYELPVNSYPTVLGASVCYSNYELAGEYKNLDATGSSFTTELYARQPLWRMEKGKLYFTGGGRYRKIEDEFGLFDVEESMHTLAGYADLAGEYKFDGWTASGRVRYTFGSLTYDENDFGEEDRSYGYVNADAGLAYDFNRDVRLSNRLESQISGNTLESSDRFQVTGPQGISAFNSSDGVGDSGVLDSIRLSYHPQNFLGFYIAPHFDTGLTKLKSQDGSSHFTGLGIDTGISYKGFYLKAQADLAAGSLEEDQNRGKLWFRFGYAG